MSVASQDVYLNLSTPLTVIGSGGGATSTFSTFNVSSLNALNLTAGFIESANISSMFGEFDEIFCSSISTLGIIIDDQILTATNNQLLLNGVPVATNSSLSSIADWSLDAAISTLNMNGNSSINGSLLSTQVINAGSALITSLVCSTISSVQLETQAGIFSSINGIQVPQGIQTISSFNTASVSSLTVSSINNLSYPPPNSDVSQWANFPAVSTITGGAGATDDLKLSATRFLNANASGVNIVVDEGANVASLATFSVVAQNGNRGNISLTANPGVGGVFGQIGLTANGGTVAGVGAGGLIELTANTPLGSLSNVTSAIKLSAAGINSYAGAVPSVGSLLGYNFIYGTLGVNLCAGLPSVFPSIPGTTFLYGTAGITLGSQTNTGSDFTQSAGGLYTTLLTGYWAGGVFSPQNLVIRGRQIPVYGNSYVQLCNVDILSFDSGARKAITGVSTINGVSYPPPQDAIPSNLTVSSLTAANSVGTQALTVSSVNGSSYPPPVGGIPANLVVSTLTADIQVSTPQLFVSSINGAAYSPSSSIPSTLIVSTLIASTSVTAPLISVSTLVNISTINGASYPPAASIPPSLVVSSLTAAVDVITFALSADTVLANVYVCTPQIVVSTLSAQITTMSSLIVSSINGNKPSEPALSTLIINGGGSITLEDDPATTSSAPIFFKTGSETVNEGILDIRKAGGYTDPSSRSYTGLAVEAFSTLGALQPVICGSLLINPTPNVYVGAPISGNTAGDILFPMSSIVGISTINGAPFNINVKQATYYTSTVQTLTSGNTDIIFDSAGSWNNDGGYITHTAGTSTFTVVNAGLYQLEFNAVVLANGATYLLTDQGKQVAIDVTRGTEQSVISNTALQASQQNYSMFVLGTYYLNASDVINLRIRNTFTGGPPTIQPVANTFDLNTFFTWRFIS